jgi:hypothetical protein
LNSSPTFVVAVAKFKVAGSIHIADAGGSALIPDTMPRKATVTKRMIKNALFLGELDSEYLDLFLIFSPLLYVKVEYL